MLTLERQLVDDERELEAARRELRRSEWAPLDRRVTDEAGWRASVARKQERVRELEEVVANTQEQLDTEEGECR